MDLYEIKANLENIQNQMELIITNEYLDSLRNEITVIEKEMLDPDFYLNQARVKEKSAIISLNKHVLDSYNNIYNLINDINEYLIILNDEYDETIDQEINVLIKQLMEAFDAFEILLLMNEEYDQNDAIIDIYVGAGGTESQDWVEMLYKMYIAYAKKKDFRVELIAAHYATDVGIKSITFRVEGLYAYGLLKNEKGVHRLIRISPFDSSGKRHTTFAMVSVAPAIEDIKEIELNENDLAIDTYKSSGAGGQSVNTTDSAVRITHLPTGIVVTSQHQRSQLQNKAEAINVLKSKLLERQLEEQRKELQAIKGDVIDVNFGSQIRTYVFHPYSMVKDHRSNYETSNPNYILGGNLDEIINSVLRKNKGR